MHIGTTQDVYTHFFVCNLSTYPAGMAVWALPESRKEEGGGHVKSTIVNVIFLTYGRCIHIYLLKRFRMINWWVSSRPGESFVRWISSGMWRWGGGSSRHVANDYAGGNGCLVKIAYTRQNLKWKQSGLSPTKFPWIQIHNVFGLMTYID